MLGSCIFFCVCLCTEFVCFSSLALIYVLFALASAIWTPESVFLDEGQGASGGVSYFANFFYKSRPMRRED